MLPASLRLHRAQALPREPLPGARGPSPPAPNPLRARMTDPRTLLPLALVGLVIGLALTRTRFDLGQTFGVMRQTRPLPYAAAFVAFYLSVAIRGVRWRLLLANAGERLGLGRVLGMLMLAWLTNCLLPAKMGDLYRAYLLRRYPISASKGLGTIFTERVLDFLVLMALLIVTGLISFHNHVPRVFLPVLLTGVAVSVAMVAALLLARFSDGLLPRLVVPAGAALRVRRFREGLLDSLGNLPALLLLTALVWSLESTRLYLVLQALPLHFTVSVPQVMFIALVAALLTTIPALPGGLILVEGGIVAVLAFFGLNPSAGLSVALLDRFVSYWSIIGVGLTVFVFSRKT